MSTKKDFYKRAFGNTITGRIIASLEFGLVVSFITYMVLDLIIKDDAEIIGSNATDKIQLYFSISMFIIGSLLGLKRSYPVINFHPTSEAVKK